MSRMAVLPAPYEDILILCTMLYTQQKLLEVVSYRDCFVVHVGLSLLICGWLIHAIERYVVVYSVPKEHRLAARPEATDGLIIGTATVPLTVAAQIFCYVKPHEGSFECRCFCALWLFSYIFIHFILFFLHPPLFLFVFYFRSYLSFTSAL